MIWFQGDNVILVVNVSWSSSKSTRKPIVNWNVWPTWRSDIATAVPSTCPVSLFCFFELTFKWPEVLFDLSGSEGTPICKYDQHKNCPGYAQTMMSQFSQLNFICDSSSIDREIDCNCLSSCDEIVYEIQDKDKDDYQQDEIESSKTNLEG